MERILNQSIREQQDEAYMESLRADQEKQRQRDLEREEIRKIELEKERLIQEELRKQMVRTLIFIDFTSRRTKKMIPPFRCRNWKIKRRRSWREFLRNRSRATLIAFAFHSKCPMGSDSKGDFYPPIP